MSDFLEASEKEKSQKIKSNEITGERYRFHSLPKEFQDMSNSYYIQEKEAQGSVDKNAVSKANLNGYMWMALEDGASWALLLTVSAIFAIIKWKLSSGLLGFFVSAIIYIPILIYIGYHFIYYAIIRSQAIGPITRSITNYTSNTFYVTFACVFSSLMFVFIFCISIIEDILLLIFKLITYMSSRAEPDSMQETLLNGLIWIHNKAVEIFIGSNSFWDNIYTIFAIVVLPSVLFLYWFEKSHYDPNRQDSDDEFTKTGIKQGYPIETVQKAMKSWRAIKEKELVKAFSGTSSFTDNVVKQRKGGSLLNANIKQV